jgi:pantothenate kinase
MACHLAEWLAQQRRHADAARLIGWVARRHAERGETATDQGERARERALAALASVADAAQLAAWQAEGERWNDDDAAEAVLG